MVPKEYKMIEEIRQYLLTFLLVTVIFKRYAFSI